MDMRVRCIMVAIDDIGLIPIAHLPHKLVRHCLELLIADLFGWMKAERKMKCWLCNLRVFPTLALEYAGCIISILYR